jgi:hypothetical protein
MVNPFAKHVLAAIALGLAIGVLPGCTPSAGEAAQQQSSALEPISIADCELTKSTFKCSMFVQGFRCDHDVPTVFEQADGEGSSLPIACASAALQLANSQRADSCHAWGNHRQQVEEKTRVNKGKCKAYVTTLGPGTLSGGTTLRPSGGWWVNGVGVEPGSPGATGVFLR